MRIENDDIVVFENLVRRGDDLVGVEDENRNLDNIRATAAPFHNPNAPGVFPDVSEADLNGFYKIGLSVGTQSRHFC